MPVTFKIKKTILALALLGCSDGLTDDHLDQECEVYNELYSHSVLFCGGRDLNNIEDVFQVCNHRNRAEAQQADCVVNFDLLEFDDDCDVQHVCINEWTEEQ